MSLILGQLFWKLALEPLLGDDRLESTLDLQDHRADAPRPRGVVSENALRTMGMQKTRYTHVNSAKHHRSCGEAVYELSPVEVGVG